LLDFIFLACVDSRRDDLRKAELYGIRRIRIPVVDVLIEAVILAPHGTHEFLSHVGGKFQTLILAVMNDPLIQLLFITIEIYQFILDFFIELPVLRADNVQLVTTGHRFRRTVPSDERDSFYLCLQHFGVIHRFRDIGICRIF